MAEYIEREALLDEVLRMRNCHLLSKSDGAKVEKMVQKFPAADVAPVVHARWEKRDGQTDPGMFCSACGEYEGWARKHCPYCGAKMDEE